MSTNKANNLSQDISPTLKIHFYKSGILLLLTQIIGTVDEYVAILTTMMTQLCSMHDTRVDVFFDI